MRLADETAVHVRTGGGTVADVWWYSRIRGKQLPPEQSVVWQMQVAEEFAAMMNAGEAAAHVN
jgi:hypothetical protein